MINVILDVIFACKNAKIERFASFSHKIPELIFFEFEIAALNLRLQF